MALGRKKKESSHQVLEDAGIGFDPSTQHLDLTKDEKRRMTSLMLATQAYKELIIRDADYLREVQNIHRNNNDGYQIRPATMEAILDAAKKFDYFIANGIPPFDGSAPGLAPEELAEAEVETVAEGEEHEG